MPDPTRSRTNVESAARGPTMRNHKDGFVVVGHVVAVDCCEAVDTSRLKAPSMMLGMILGL